MSGYSRNHGPVWLYRQAMRFGVWLQNLPSRTTPPPFRLLQIGSAFWQSRALYVAARLDVATVLGGKSRPIDELATDVGAEPDALYRMLRLLGAVGVFEERPARWFRNNRVSSWLRQDWPDNMRAMVLMHNSAEMSRPWYEQLEHGVLTGEVPFAATHGEDLYQYMDAHPQFDALFSAAMESVDALTGDAFASDFDWGRFERIIDIGGSKGKKSAAILKRHPGMTAVVFDRPNVIAQAQTYWQAHSSEVAPARLSFEPGDLIEAVPAAQSARDIYLLAAVLHGLPDAQCVKVLRNVVQGAAGRASVAIMETVVPEAEADYMSASFDMQMFMGTNGRERTLAEWRALLEESGLSLSEVVDIRAPWKIILASPARA